MKIVGFLNRLWHTRVMGHTVTYHPSTRPDSVIRDPAGKPLIAVYEQTEFTVPVAHWKCSCGVMWV